MSRGVGVSTAYELPQVFIGDENAIGINGLIGVRFAYDRFKYAYGRGV